MLPSLWLGFAHPQPVGGLSILWLFHELDTSAGRVSPLSWCQEASVAAVTLSEGSGEGFPSHQGVLGWIRLGLWQC